MCGGEVVREEANVQSPPNSTHLRHLLTPIDTRRLLFILTFLHAAVRFFLMSSFMHAVLIHILHPICTCKDDVTYIRSISMPVDLCRHLVGKNSEECLSL